MKPLHWFNISLPGLLIFRRVCFSVALEKPRVAVKEHDVKFEKGEQEKENGEMLVIVVAVLVGYR